MIRHHRDGKGMSQEDLGNAAGIDSSQIGKFERGEIVPTIASLRRIADVFQIECNELLDDVPKSDRWEHVRHEAELFREKLSDAVGESNGLLDEYDKLMKVAQENF